MEFEVGAKQLVLLCERKVHLMIVEVKMFILMCLVGGVSECSPVELMVWWNELKMNEKVIVCVCVGGVEVWNGFFLFENCVVCVKEKKKCGT